MTVGKTNPLRQTMINMMYLVLTALLALNVSAEILKAFSTVNIGMKKSIKLIDEKNGLAMSTFEKLYQATPGAVKDYYDRAKECNTISNDFYKYVENLKNWVIDESGGLDDKGNIKRESDLNVPARMVRSGVGEKLFNEIQRVRKLYIELVKKIPKWSETDAKNFIPNITVDAKHPEKGSKTWAEESFHMVPSIAAVTLLTKIQNDIRNTQANILDNILNSIGRLDYKFDSLVPVVKTDKAAVATGEKYECKIFLAAYDSKQQPDIIIGDKSYDVTAGMASYENTPTVQGTVDIPGKIVQKNKSTGEAKEFPFRIKYDVFNAPAIISATKMNVVYIGLENPISVSVPGFAPKDIVATCSSGGNLKPDAKPGDYLLGVPDTRGQVKEVTINVAVKSPNGGSRPAGTKVFRIKYVPKPTPYFGSKEGGPISAGEVRIVEYIRVNLNDFAFEGIKYTVTKFQMVYNTKIGAAKFEKTTSGARLTPGMKAMLSNPEKDSKIIVFDIYATAPGIGEKKVPDMVLMVQ